MIVRALEKRGKAARKRGGPEKKDMVDRREGFDILAILIRPDV